MSNNKNTGIKTGVIVGLILGSIISFVAYHFIMPTQSGSHEVSSSTKDTKEPLYWVAPMDANFRKDKPGKSPMGMDLVPVYDNAGKGPNEGAGTIHISSSVENNLGVRTVIATIKPLDTKINTVGYVTYNEDKLVYIHPRVQGWIEKLYVTAAGEPVKKGQALYQIYSPELVNAQEEMLLALARKNSRLIDSAENRLRALHTPKQTIEYLKRNQKVQQNVTFYASQSGVIESLNIREGIFVEPKTMLLSIVDLSQIWVKAEVFERQSAQLAMGNNAVMTLGYLPDQEWHGKIEHIHPMLKSKTRTAIARIRFDNVNHKLKPNMFAQIAIDTGSNESVLQIPKEALIRTGSQDRVVLALGEGSFKSVEVKVGRYNHNNVEILSGLTEGERVVSSAQFLLDSESSKSSDFKRMSADEPEQEEIQSPVWVQAQIESLMIEGNMLTLNHEPIPEWDWPEMMMDFSVIDTVDASQLKEGIHLRVKINKKTSGGYQVIDIELPEATSLNKTSSSLSLKDKDKDKDKDEKENEMKNEIITDHSTH